MKAFCFWTFFLLATWLLFSLLLPLVRISILKPSDYVTKIEDWLRGGRGVPRFRIASTEKSLGLWVPVHGPQNHQAGPTESYLGFRKISGNKVFQTMFPIFKASVFDSSLTEGSSHLYCQCCLKTFNIPKKNSALFRTEQDSTRIDEPQENTLELQRRS